MRFRFPPAPRFEPPESPGCRRLLASFLIALVGCGASEPQLEARGTDPIQAPVERVTDSKILARPFGEGTGSVWIRRKGSAHFEPLSPLPAESGGGYALQPGIFDLVLAPKNRCATILVSTRITAETPLAPAASPPTRPSVVQARLVNPEGAGLRDKPTLEVSASQFPKDAPPSTPVFRGWQDFYRDIGFTQSKDGTLAIAPVPCETMFFFVRFPHRRPATLSTVANISHTLDLGEQVLPELATLTLRVEDRRERPSERRTMDLAGTLIKPGPGLSVPGPLSRKWERALPATEDGAITVDVFPGDWLIEVRIKGRTVGTHRMMALEGDSVEDSFTVENLTVAGRVESARGKPIPGARVDVAFLVDGMNPLARAKTDSEGRFSETISYGGGPLTLTVMPGTGGLRREEVDPSRLDIEDLRIRLGAGRAVVSVLEKESGAPVPEVSVVARFENPRGVARLSSISRPDGQAVFEDIDMGDFAVDLVENAEWSADAEDLGGKAKITAEKPNVELEVRVKPARRVTVVLPGSSPGAKVLGPINAGDTRYQPVSVDAVGKAEITVPRGHDAVFAAVAPGQRITFFRVGPDDQRVQIALRPKRDASALSFSLTENDNRNPFGVLVAAYGIPVPVTLLAMAMSVSGCGLSIPSLAGQSQFDRCLDDGSYQIWGVELAPRRQFELTPSTVELREGNVLTVTPRR